MSTAGLIESTLKNHYATPVLDGMPVGTEFSHQVAGGRIVMYLWTPPHDWMTYEVVDEKDFDLVRESFVRRIERRCRSLRMRHTIALHVSEAPCA